MKRTNFYLTIFLILGAGIIFFFFSGNNFNELGLKVLQWVKAMKGDSVDLDQMDTADSNLVNYTIWDDLLQSHVDSTGKVDYKGLLGEAGKLDSFLLLLSENPPRDNFTENEKLAYWINAYNAFTVRLVLDHYPVGSIKEIGGGLTMINSPWDIRFFRIGGVEFDLNTIEHEVLRKLFREPRIHFAINCASVSCPRLRNEAYKPEILEMQLEEQASEFINDRDKNIITPSSLELSRIFDWFRSDFTNNRTLISYIRQFSEVKISDDAAIDYVEYNWKLNE